ncbi:thermosome subunit alpha [Halomontanus rarus]|uniref:thermosome subunit alpha n=1 Tax=Halomontanus rarus TaxID=3034020 RepID=UPI0023E859D5|nr:thermosome subunit alpha [Halovivax sp. TS33]
MGNQPMVVLSEESQRTSGDDAQSMNITAGKAVGEAVRTTLGPKGMDKLLVGSTGEVVVTNDGVTILEEMEIDHPAANMIVEVAETQEEEVSDGTTSAVIVGGDLLKQAEDLLEQDVHATSLVQGYRQAAEEATQIVEDMSIDVGTDDTKILQQIAATAMTGKGAENAKDQLAELIVNAVSSVADDDGVDTDNIEIKKAAGGALEDSELVEGVLVDKEPVHQNMPYLVEDANVAVLDDSLEVKETEVDTEVNVTDPDQLQQFLDQEEEQLREMVDEIVGAGADVVFAQDGIDDMAQHYLAEEGILAVRRIKSSDAEKIAHSTGARIVSNVTDIGAADLGSAGTVSQREIGGSQRIHIEGVEDAQPVTLLLRGGTEHVVDEIERAIEDSLGVVRVTLENGKALPGGGAPETQIARELRQFADSVGGREQLAVEAFADALEVIPRTLAENGGLDPIDSLVELRSQHEAGKTTAGLNAYTGEVINMEAEGVVEPLRVKTQAIESATEAAVMLLRIDDVIAAGELKGGQVDGDDDDAGGPPAGGPGGGMGGGMGGMGGMGGAM